MHVSDFDFDLPEALIAQEPPKDRGASRLMRLDRRTGATTVGVMADIVQWLQPGDLLVVNDTRVFPARLLGHRLPGGGRIECLLIREVEPLVWEALVHPGQRIKAGTRFVLEGEGGAIDGEVLARDGFGRRTVRLSPRDTRPLDEVIEAIGHMPLPPYIHRPDRPEDRERYQTVFSRVRGSVAAPTAGLHFTPDLLAQLDARGVERVSITHHVGYGTFKPVRVDEIEAHTVDAETYSIEADVADAINRARVEGRRIVVVGTTTTRALESAVRAGDGVVRPGRATTELYIYPGFEFRLVQALVTNFHVPRSSLLFLVCAFAGREHVLAAYQRAIAEGFRFYSYGDAMLIE
jgi:S-adenosylmethionine:tRNA ribosyltransferase-isomerase